MSTPQEHPGIIETRLVHEVHRRGTSLLAAAVAHLPIDRAAVGELRDAIVDILRHHHESEDRDLWPLLTGAAPELAPALEALTAEHERLEARLTAVEKLTFGADTAELLAKAAVALRDEVHDHLADEEPVLFPAVSAHITTDQWDQFSRRTVASAPVQWTHVLLALIDEVGEPDAIALTLRNAPPEARQMFPAARQRGRAVLDALSPAGERR